MKTALVTGASGFLGNALVKRLKADGYHVRGISRSDPPYERTLADEFMKTDLRYIKPNDSFFKAVDEVYQCAGHTGGIPYLENPANAYRLLDDNIRMNQAILDACIYQEVGRLLFVSSGCVYPHNDKYEVEETDAYPAACTNEFGWASLFTERLYDAANRCGKITTRIVRLHSTYGPGCRWQGGAERAPAALCRKVAMAPDGGQVEMIGDGRQVRSFMYIDDAIEGLRRVMASPCVMPVNVGSTEEVWLNYLLWLISEVAGKHVSARFVKGAVGARGRSSNNRLLRHVTGGWEPSISLEAGLRQLYPWVAQQVALDREAVVV